MKTKATLIVFVAMAAGVSYMDMRAQTPTPTPPPTTKLAYPYGQECVVTVDPQASRNTHITSQSEPSGFHPDGTLRGQLIYLSDEWCVLKDGTFESWIPRNKVLLIRASK